MSRRDSRRTAWEREEVEPWRPRRVLAAPPRVERCDVRRDRRRDGGEPVDSVRGNRVDDVHLVAGDGVEEPVARLLVVPAPRDGAGGGQAAASRAAKTTVPIATLIVVRPNAPECTGIVRGPSGSVIP